MISKNWNHKLLLVRDTPRTYSEYMDTNSISVLGLCGSLRFHSYNMGLLRAARDILPAGMHLHIADLGTLPLLNQDLEQAPLPQSIIHLRQQIEEADALLFATPEHNHTVPSILTNAIHWASRPPTSVLEGKPVAIMGASTGWFGTVRAQNHLRQICQATHMIVLQRPEVFVPKAEEKFDAQGNLLDESTKQKVSLLLESFAQWIQQLRKK